MNRHCVGSPFGESKEGCMIGPAGSLGDATVHRIGLRAGDLEVSILTFGATIEKLLVHGPRGPRHAVLGFDSCEEYLQHRLYMGCVVGRFANRIAAGRFRLDGMAYQLSRNENGNHLHGGFQGFSHRVWAIESATERAACLSLVSPAGEEGYPGTLTVGCCYSIEGDRSLRIALTAVTDAPTIVNLATHSYFNLDGQGDILRHRLEIPADAYLPTDAAGIPTGEFRSVDATPFDFRTMRDVQPAHRSRQRYDNTYVLAPSEGIRKAARLESTNRDIAMEVWSTEPGIQFFDAATMRSVSGRDGCTYGPYSGLCLEPQRFPDSPNHGGFTDCALHPGRTYRQVTEYRFDVS
jgi:aldose 1-epimerase